MSSPRQSTLMDEEKQLPLRRTLSVSLPNRLGPSSIRRQVSDGGESKSRDVSERKKNADKQREQEFKMLQMKHKHKVEMDALKKDLRDRGEKIDNLTQQLSTQEKCSAAYEKEIEKQRKLLKETELEFETRLNQLKTNLENIHLQELQEKVKRARKEEQSAARLQVEELQEQMEAAKRIEKNETRRNEEDYQVTLLQLQIEDLQTQIRELKCNESGEKGAKETLLKMNKELMQEVSTSTKKMMDVEAHREQLVSSKMQFVEKCTAEIARLHHELNIARMELVKVKSELESQRQIAAKATQALKMSTSPRADILTLDRKNSRTGRRSSVTDSVTSERKYSRTRSATAPRPEIRLERKNSKGTKTPRSENFPFEKKQQRNGMKLARPEQLSLEKKPQRAARKSVGSEHISFEKLEKKQARNGRKSPLSPKLQRTEQPFEKKPQRARRKSTGSEWVTLEKQQKIRDKKSENMLPEKKRSKNGKKPPRTEHVSVKKQRRNGKKNGVRSKSPKTEHIDKKHLRRRSSLSKTKGLDKPYKAKTKSVELKHNKHSSPNGNKHSSPNGYELASTDEPRPFGISRDDRIPSAEKRSKSFRRAKSHSLLIRPRERDKRRRGSRTLRDSLKPSNMT